MKVIIQSNPYTVKLPLFTNLPEVKMHLSALSVQLISTQKQLENSILTQFWL